ncbi:MAG: hypothetical protein OEW39_07080 [Deltaproteobacteria bacterium]|nr:hypothetical protein [Deltaproteobacteria bacterium]
MAAKKTVYCEECMEDIPNGELLLEDSRLYCGRCGGEVEAPDPDIFETIVDNRSAFLFRSDTEDMDEEDEEDDLEPDEEDDEMIAEDEDEDER